MTLKKILNKAKYLSAVLFISLSLFSCQSEETEISNPESSDTLDTDSTLTNLISKTVLNEDSENSIKCIDFEYPILVSVFNTSFDVASTENIDSDTQFSSFLETLGNDIIANINYPVITIFSNGVTLEVNDNLGLQNALLDGEGANCEEIVVIMPPTEDACTQASTIENLSSCKWTITSYSRNGEAGKFDGNTIFFDSDNSLVIADDSNPLSDNGDWEILEDDDELILSIDTPEIDISWPITECGDNRIEAIGENGFITIVKDCSDGNEPIVPQSCFQDSIIENFIDCRWSVNRYSIESEFENSIIAFNEDNSLVLFQNGSPIDSGEWDVFAEGERLVLNISSEIINLSWPIVECNDEIVQATDDDETIVLGRDCSEDDNVN